MLPSDYVRRGWCQGAMAEIVDGYRVSEDDERAVKWCILGAVWKAFDDDSIALRYTDELHKYIGKDVLLGNWNDELGRTQKEVVSLLEKVEKAIFINAST